ncbi:CinA family nicotinamide mononucleotide deamidase-related protein [Vibrio metoecus]|uniref:CinA family nicotinamide mononucleotide deamidase-related protein n=1 Tax=Vibrio metoecus TaxID=1481663 RepID=UPI0006D7EEC9|nr:CinA family nicotinamide mononucleotide deamidase-related protein [Vibrio metoecus]KQA22001.1 damage-inducible protein CinA [Vibrio metoecus]
MLKIAMLSTGEEVLHGDIVDSNAAWLAREFYQHGFSLSKRSTVGDSQPALVEELMMLSFNSDVVIVNGGLGPTSDDMTAEAAAQAAEQPLVMNAHWLSQLEAFFAGRGRAMPDSNRKQAMLPANAELIDNPVGTACGFKMQINDCWFYFTPGVPKEFYKMVSEQILPDLQRQFPSVLGQQCSRLYTFGTSESSISDKLDKMHLPEGYILGYRSYLPFIEVKLFGPEQDDERRLSLLKIIHAHLEQYVVSIDEPMLAYLGHMMTEKGLSLAFAEQVTQGWLSSWLLGEPQIEALAGPSWILSHKVSSELAQQDPLAAAFALAGATKDKCGTQMALVTGALKDEQVSVALSTPNGEWGQTVKFVRRFSVQEQKEWIATLAADMLLRYLTGRPMFVGYSAVERIKEMYLPKSALN